MSLQILNESEVRPNAKKCASGVDITQIKEFVPNAREEIAKFPEIWRAARTKTACIRPATAAHAAKRRLKLSESTMRSIPKKRAFGVEITQMLRQNRAEEMQNF